MESKRILGLVLIFVFLLSGIAYAFTKDTKFLQGRLIDLEQYDDPELAMFQEIMKACLVDEPSTPIDGASCPILNSTGMPDPSCATEADANKDRLIANVEASASLFYGRPISFDDLHTLEGVDVTVGSIELLHDIYTQPVHHMSFYWGDQRSNFDDLIANLPVQDGLTSDELGLLTSAMLTHYGRYPVFLTCDALNPIGETPGFFSQGTSIDGTMSYSTISANGDLNEIEFSFVSDPTNIYEIITYPLPDVRFRFRRIQRLLNEMYTRLDEVQDYLQGTIYQVVDSNSTMEYEYVTVEYQYFPAR